jgi:outer membrane protein OmpA-like peptidoglycan-associated protein/tetratricopeptide (TPR) repeat protein
MRIYILLILFIGIFQFKFAINSFGQSKSKEEFTSTSKKAIKSFKRALTFFEAQKFNEAMVDVDLTLDADSTFIEAYLLGGQIMELQKKNSQSLYYYRKAAMINPDFYPNVLYIIASKEYELGDYKNSYNHYLQYYNHPNKDKRLNTQIEHELEQSEFCLYQISHPLNFNPINIGTNINTSQEEYINSISTDENTLIFTRKMKKVNEVTQKSMPDEEDFFISYKDPNGVWSFARAMSNQFNTHGNEGAMNISPDGIKMVFTASHRDDGLGRCDIYISYRKGNGWTTPVNMGPGVNGPSWDSNPCLSSDGKSMYYVSNRSGGLGNSDIWMVQMDEYGIWGNAQNLGNNVNSKGSEMTPFIHPDGQTLYFSSNGHLGMGNYDLYMCKRDKNGKWSSPINLGYPLNDKENQMGILINSRGDLAYISSQQNGGEGKYDIFYFELDTHIRPNPVNYMKGILVDEQTKKPIKAAFELFDLATNTMIIQSESDAATGSFMVVIPTNSSLALNVNKEGYLFHSENFKLEPGDYSVQKPYLKNVSLKPLKLDQTIVLNNVFFATLSFDLKPESEGELKKVMYLLINNPTIIVEIGGHTDDVGSEVDNQKLSEKRAKAVYDYLVVKGIKANQLAYKGYGEKAPFTENSSEEGRALNRRTELKIIGIK